MISRDSGISDSRFEMLSVEFMIADWMAKFSTEISNLLGPASRQGLTQKG